MRIVLDLQGAQTEGSRFRGIGRYSMSFAKALAREATSHEIWLLLNARLDDSIEPILASFYDVIPPERIRLFESPGPVAEVDPKNSWRTQASELLREKFLADLQPDIVHVSSMCEGTSNEATVSAGRFRTDIPTTAQLYDLIPLLNSKRLLDYEPYKRTYLRHVQSLRQAHLLLAISESSRKEAIEALQVHPDRVKVIGAGLADSLRIESAISEIHRQSLRARYSLQREFILYTGAIDLHKNVEGLFAAYAMLRSDLRETHQLALAGKLRELRRKALQEAMGACGIKENEIRFLGFVPDEDLRLLYRSCKLFVFPSLHEGFGLPVLEAMACGAAVIGSNCTSIPEIISRRDALFDPHNPRDIATLIEEVLSNSTFRECLQAWGPERAKEFTWEKCASKALKAFEILHNEYTSRRRLGSQLQYCRPLLGFVSPLPPDQSELALYATNLLPYLARYYEVVCIAAQASTSDAWLTAEFPIRDARWFEANAERFERIIYHFGDSCFGMRMVALLEKYPGISLMNEFDLSGMFGGCRNALRKMLYDSHGFSGLRKWAEERELRRPYPFPCNSMVLRNSIGVIVRSDQEIESVRNCYGEKATTWIRKFPFDHAATSTFEAGTDGDSGRDLRLQTPTTSSTHRERIAATLRDMVEELYATSPQAEELRLIRAIGRISALTTPSQSDVEGVAAALAANREGFGQAQFLIDVTKAVQGNENVGNKKRLGAVLTWFVDNPPADYRIEPTRLDVYKGFVYARQFAVQCLGLSEPIFVDEKVRTCRGDVYLGLESEIPGSSIAQTWFKKQRLRGVKVFFVINGLTSNECSNTDSKSDSHPRDRLAALLEIADGAVCATRKGALDLLHSLTTQETARALPFHIGFLSSGDDAAIAPAAAARRLIDVITAQKWHATWPAGGGI